MSILILFILFIIFAIVLIIIQFLFVQKGPKGFNPKNKHIIITGGSSGIGLSTAILFAKRGANITILARDIQKLNSAIETLNSFKCVENQKFLSFSVDVSNWQQVENAINLACEQNSNRIDVLICSAGIARPGRFLELPIEQFEQQMKTNYIGSVYSVRASVPFMKQQKSGRIILISSMAGLVGLFGYTAYSPTKFALRGFAESLHMELAAFNIFVSISFPPDVDTPQLEAENKWKPIETKLMAEGTGIVKPEQIANDIYANLKNWSFYINTSLDGFLLGNYCCGFIPAASVSEILLQLFLLPLGRIISLFVTMQFRSIVNKHKTN
eukprot:TRINITY_DN4357_c0_g1_i1.p1 TRINITY_DN4357_c0_g1~~TRINITY_DN4357_c0_g1_i1.p1  ORF type:complete len:347 (+),score=163.42 TRINITY_DN4357_c0_g1_i1:65-1042(+)